MRHRGRAIRFAALSALGCALFSSICLPALAQDEVVALQGARIITDGWSGYNPLQKRGFVHEVRNLGGVPEAASELLPNVHRAIALLKRWLVGTHQGAVRPKQLQHYLEEFAFRHNRRKSLHVGKIFYRLVQGVCLATPAPYWKLVGRSAPGRPLHMGAT